MGDKPEKKIEVAEAPKEPESPGCLADLTNGPDRIKPPLTISDTDRPKVEAAFDGKKIDETSVTTLNYDEMIGAEKKENGTLCVLFGRKADKKEGFRGMALKEKYEVGDKILVNFQGNESAYWEIGAGDMLPENVRQARICDAAGNCRSGTRQGLRGGFYDESGGYIPVFDNYTVEVVEVWSDEKMAQERTRLEEEEKKFYKEFEQKYGLEPGHLKPSEMRQMETELNKLKDSMEKRPKWRGYMDEAMNFFGVPKDAECLFWGIIRRESGFNPACLNSKSSATGLGQHLKGTWKDIHAFMQRKGVSGIDAYREVSDTLCDLGPTFEGAGVRAQIFSVVAYAVRARGMVNKNISKISGQYGVSIPDQYRLKFDDLKAADITSWYLAYHEGPLGYANLTMWFAETGGINHLTQEGYDRYLAKDVWAGSQKTRGLTMNNVMNYARKAALSAMSYKSFLNQSTNV